jgi:hypothetical protein
MVVPSASGYILETAGALQARYMRAVADFLRAF